MEILDVSLLVMAIIAALTGVVGCILPVLPGPPITYLMFPLLHWGGFAEFGVWEYIIWAFVAIAITVVDFLLAPYMTKQFGGSNAGGWGSLIGLVVAMIALGPFGVLVGPFVGALVAELCVSKKKMSEALLAAVGSFLSFFVGSGFKMIVCFGMMIYAACRVFGWI